LITKKVCLLGEFAVGKTSLADRFVRHTFSEKYLTTVGVKVDTKTIDVPGKGSVKLVIWDINGTDGFSIVEKNYLRGASGVILVVDGTRRETLESALKLKQTVANILGECSIIGLLNKADLDSQWEVSQADIADFRKSGIQIYETSAKSGVNVNSAFEHLAQMLVAK